MLIGAIGIIVCSFLLCFYTIPILVKIANRFNIYDTPSHIKKHNRNITFLGGVALIVAFIIPISLFLPEEIQKPKYLTAYLILITIIFLHGIGDDFFNYSPKKNSSSRQYYAVCLYIKQASTCLFKVCLPNLHYPKVYHSSLH
jgi:UDP-N-acetylmuramyl pentapeptide phosphotransferase/UDP-N-acetylglucosamine-1-phosphate transferase